MDLNLSGKRVLINRSIDSASAPPRQAFAEEAVTCVSGAARSGGQLKGA